MDISTSVTCSHCNVKVQVNKIKEHYEETHTTVVLFKGVQPLFIQPPKVVVCSKVQHSMALPDFNPCKKACTRTPVLIDNQFSTLI